MLHTHCSQSVHASSTGTEVHNNALEVCVVCCLDATHSLLSICSGQQHRHWGTWQCTRGLCGLLSGWYTLIALNLFRPAAQALRYMGMHHRLSTDWRGQQHRHWGTWECTIIKALTGEDSSTGTEVHGNAPLSKHWLERTAAQALRYMTMCQSKHWRGQQHRHWGTWQCASLSTGEDSSTGTEVHDNVPV